MSYLEKINDYIIENFSDDKKMLNKAGHIIRELHKDYGKTYRFIYEAIIYKSPEDFKRFNSFGLLMNDRYMEFIDKKLELERISENEDYEKTMNELMNEENDRCKRGFIY